MALATEEGHFQLRVDALGPGWYRRLKIAGFEAEYGDSWNKSGGTRHCAEALEDSAAVEVFSPVREDYLTLKLLRHAEQENIAKGRKGRIDCTVVESNTHKSFDSLCRRGRWMSMSTSQISR
ncbi:MAG: hypothetical protein U5R30_03345 [Deltaproteobacteria bacterium]|nr:hypothetical protein [Deltaproteobacteria bacterium]